MSRQMPGSKGILQKQTQAGWSLRAKRPLILAAAALLTLGTMAGFAQNGGIFPIDSNPYDHTYGQWASAWWQWALSVPAANNPVTDSTGQFASAGQSGPVWFLGSTFGSSEKRSLTIPAGVGIFLPVYQWIFGSSVGDCRPSNPDVQCDLPTLQASAAAATTSVQEMDVIIDGQAVAQIRNYRATSPGGFSVTLPDGNVLQSFGLPDSAGTYAPQVADGYWLMLSPLTTGKHRIKVYVVPDPNFGSTFSCVYDITVK